MSSIVVAGAGVGGMPAAYDLKKRLGKAHSVTLVNGSEHFQFTPSNPWVMVGWRTPEQVLVPIRPNVERKGIEFVASALATLDAEYNLLVTADGREIEYDHLVLCTGPRLAFEEVEGLGPHAHSQSVCTTPHATLAATAYQAFLANPRPIVVGAVPGLCISRGFVLIDAHQRNPRYPNIHAAGVCVAIPPVEATPIATGAPKTGYMIESMVTAIVDNIVAEVNGLPGTARATWSAICLADTGDGGIAFVALPQIPPRNVTWARSGKWVHYAKVAFEKYFMRKMKTGNREPVYEKYVLAALGIERLEKAEH